MMDHLVNQLDHLGHWGYLVFFVIVFLECQALVGLVMPGESLVLLGGFLASQDLFRLPYLMVVIALAAILGDSFSYELGRRLGRDWLLKHGHRVRLTPAHLERVERFLMRHGGKSVLIGHFMHIMRALLPFVAGASRMTYWRFLAYNGAGCIIWTVLFSLVGYFVGESWSLVAHWIGRIGAALAAVVLLAVACGWLWRRARRKS